MTLSFKNWIIAAFFVIMSILLVSMVFTHQTVGAQATNNSCNSGFLGFPAWYRGLTDENCQIKNPSSFGENGLSTFIWLIALNIIDIVMVFINYIAWLSFIYGGFMMLFSAGSAAEAKTARTAMLYSMIGLVLSFGAISVVSFVMDGIIKPTPQEVFISGLNIVYFVAGVVAVIMIIISGFKFVNGVYDPANIVEARNRLLYTVVGLIAIIAAYAVTNFVTGRF